MSGTKRSFSSALGGDENNSKRINMNSHAAVPAPALPVPASISAADPAVPPPASNGVYLDANGKGTAAAEASNGVAADGGAAAAVVEAPAEVPEAAEPVPNRLKPQDPTLQIREVTNNGDPANMEMLIHLKEIFHAQLPKMPKEYIVRLVFDRKHRSIVLCKSGTPIGGITYRPFIEQKFGEIAFCAVVGNAQVQGHGSRLMNELKRVAVRDDLTHFHTYADNYAIGYFAKHGFSKQLTMPRDRWVQYVKDYDGGTHMECYVHPTIPYLDQAAMYAKQREWLVERISKNSTSTRVYDGLPESAFHDGSLTKRTNIPGMAEAGWTEEDLLAQSRRKSERDSNATNKELIAIWREIEKNDNAWPFRDAVDTQEVVDYNKVVAHPIDLAQIRDNLDEVEPRPYYDSKARLKVDLDLMIKNCKIYNAENTDYWQAADLLEEKINEIFAKEEVVEGS